MTFIPILYSFMDGIYIYAVLNTFSVYYNNKFNIMSAVKLNTRTHTGLLDIYA